jgi:hypothetical protein
VADERGRLVRNPPAFRGKIRGGAAYGCSRRGALTITAEPKAAIRWHATHDCKPAEVEAVALDA